MKIIFCLSYLNVPQTISLIKSNRKKFLVITTNRSLSNLFTELYGKEKVWYLIKPNVSTFDKPISSIMNIIRKKNEVSEQLMDYENNEVYTFFTSFCFFEAWMAKELSKKNTIYHESEVKLNLSKSNGLQPLVKKLMIKIAYGVDINTYSYGGRYRFVIKDNYLAKIGAKKINIKIDENKAKNVINEKFKIGNKDILLLVGGITESGYVAEKKYHEEMDKLIKIILNHNFSIDLKMHPRFNNLFSLENELSKVESYIPGNLILENYKYVMGYATATLFEAANVGKTSISLINYFTTNNIMKKNNAKDYLKDNLSKGCKINFPKKISDIINILES